jgi:hypothetical protein
VTRVGGVGQNKRQKSLAAALNKTLAGYRQAEEYAHFGTELSPEAQADYDKGKALFKLMNQDIGEGYSLMDQQFMLDIVLGSTSGEILDIKLLKDSVKEYTAKVREEGEDSNFDLLRDELKAKVLLEIDEKKAALAKAAEEKKAADAAADVAKKEGKNGDKSDGDGGDGKDDTADKDEKSDKPDDNDKKGKKEDKDDKADEKSDKHAEDKQPEVVK